MDFISTCQHVAWGIAEDTLRGRRFRKNREAAWYVAYRLASVYLRRGLSIDAAAERVAQRLDFHLRRHLTR